MHHLTVLLTLLILSGIVYSADHPGRNHSAVRDLAMRAAQGDSVALYDLAYLHDIGYDTIPVDSARSTALYRRSALSGYPKAQNYLGFRFLKGEFLQQDTDSALFWIKKAALAGDLSAASNLGYILSESGLVAPDYDESIYWLTKAADGGVPAAESTLGDIYRYGRGTSPDTLKAVRLYTNAIMHGLRDAENRLWSMMKERWETIPADSAVKTGRYYYTHNAPAIGVRMLRRGISGNNPDALALLGDAYSKGKGTPYNHDLAVEYFLKAASGGNPSAQFVIAEYLEFFPDALPDSLPPASYWYQKAASKGVADASDAEKLLLQSE